MQARIHHLCDNADEQPRFLHISWLFAQDYCEYQLYLDQVKGVEVDATPAMLEGSAEHQRLEDAFLAKAEAEYTFEEAVEESQKTPISSRELYVEDRSLGIRGYIDELVLNPDGFTVIDDKPVGKTGKVYPSSKHQVYGYCMALKHMLRPDEQRPITAAVRARGSDRIVWSEAFDTKAEKKVQRLIKRVHGLIDGDIPFKSATKAYKCRPCRFFDVCEKRVEP
ncbi:MAG: PD-(D/E)XK nuclease family protein [Chloroflexota bacterium]|nr:PD-(D/E)XK nuclease family protein [Dehalococcoidia bacterium]MEC9271517.1 PD-(D/E)XK nuclease family protein [Chloroflexota bacterium]|tara:strand:+ start:476 stop:1144 length:669 start_codon:yes stop_codon:yes gene_type:complete